MIESVFVHSHAVKAPKCAGFYLRLVQLRTTLSKIYSKYLSISLPDPHERVQFGIALLQSGWNIKRETFVPSQTGLL